MSLEPCSWYPSIGNFGLRPEGSVGWLPDYPLAPRYHLLFLCELAGVKEAILLR